MTSPLSRSRPSRSFPASAFVVSVFFLALFILCSSFLLTACAPAEQPLPSRDSRIPAEAVRQSPATDAHPPVLHLDGWREPVPLEGPVNTAGAEDSPFIAGDDLYFFFTPDVRVPPEKQLLDGVTGIYVSHRVDGAWTAPERVLLQKPGKLALDGCAFVDKDVLWFCSAREGYEGINWFSAERKEGRWTGATKIDFPAAYEVGELHVHGAERYYHSPRAGGAGGLDIWTSENVGGAWQEPVNLAVINSPENDGWPFVTVDGNELWFTRTYQGTPAIYRSLREDGSWSAPELVVSTFAGEPTLDAQGNLYFVHHYYKDNVMLEADLYVAYKQ